MDERTARRAMDAALQAAREGGTGFSIAVTDAGAHLVAFSRMDGAILASVEVAVKKAKTAAMFRAESGQLGGLTLVLY